LFSVCITSVLNIIIKQKQLNVLQRDSLLHQLVPEIVENAIYFGTVSRELGRLPVVPVGREVGANRPGVATERPLPTAVRTPAFRPQLVHAVHTLVARRPLLVTWTLHWVLLKQLFVTITPKF
jgi:hypothetical protein